jgi:hypothetical protein
MEGPAEPEHDQQRARSLQQRPMRRGCLGGNLMAWLRLFLLMLVALPLAGCEAIGDIFQAGMAVGVIMILAVIGVIAFVVAKIKN